MIRKPTGKRQAVCCQEIGNKFSRRSGCAVQPDVRSLDFLRGLFANIRDVNFNPIRVAQGQAEEPDLGADYTLPKAA